MNLPVFIPEGIGLTENDGEKYGKAGENKGDLEAVAEITGA
jgi:hypothetical protein